MSNEKTITSVSQLGKRFSDATIFMHEAIARQAGLTGTDHKYLSMLTEGGPMTAGELAKKSGLTTGAVTGVIDRLEKRGLVKREFVKDDRRKVVIVPDLENAKQLLGPPFEILREKITGLVSALTEEEKKVIEKYLADAIRIMAELTAELGTGKKQDAAIDTQTKKKHERYNH